VRRHLYVLALFAAGGCSALPDGTASRALYIDSRKVVELGEQLDWVIDRYEIDEALPDVVPSVCETPPEERLALMRWIEQRIDEEGGSAEAIYHANGRDLGAATTVLRLERIRAILLAAEETARDECPFWLEPDPDFEGAQNLDSTTIIGESVGSGGLILQDGEVGLGGGGGGRLLLSYGWASRVTIATGLELGAAAAFPEDEAGNRTLQAQLMGAVPILVRFWDRLSLLDFEAALAWRYVNDEIGIPGVRFSVGYGLSTLRVSRFMPYVVVWLGYEYQPPREGFDTQHSLLVGTRFGINWDPF
jgi:hypothetical protein